jgi:hypothetical protein
LNISDEKHPFGYVMDVEKNLKRKKMKRVKFKNYGLLLHIITIIKSFRVKAW